MRLLWQRVVQLLRPKYESRLTILQSSIETYGEEYDHVAAIGHNEPNRIWTYIDDEEGNTCIVNGWAFVNRIGYFITQKPYDDMLNIIVQLDRE